MLPLLCDSSRSETIMDLSLDDIIKNTAKANKKPAGKAPGGGAAGKLKAQKKAAGKAPGGKKGTKMKIGGKLTGISKAKKGKTKMMDVEMGGTGSAKKKPKKKGVVGKLKDTLQALSLIHI